MRTCRWCGQQMSDEQPYEAMLDHAMTAHEDEYLEACRLALMHTLNLTDDEECDEIQGIERYRRGEG